jgi:hypothetical protein
VKVSEDASQFLLVRETDPSTIRLSSPEVFFQVKYSECQKSNDDY